MFTSDIATSIVQSNSKLRSSPAQSVIEFAIKSWTQYQKIVANALNDPGQAAQHTIVQHVKEQKTQFMVVLRKAGILETFEHLSAFLNNVLHELNKCTPKDEPYAIKLYVMLRELQKDIRIKFDSYVGTHTHSSYYDLLIAIDKYNNTVDLLYNYSTIVLKTDAADSESHASEEVTLEFYGSSSVHAVSDIMLSLNRIIHSAAEAIGSDGDIFIRSIEAGSLKQILVGDRNLLSVLQTVFGRAKSVPHAMSMNWALEQQLKRVELLDKLNAYAKSDTDKANIEHVTSMIIEEATSLVLNEKLRLRVDRAVPFHELPPARNVSEPKYSTPQNIFPKGLPGKSD